MPRERSLKFIFVEAVVFIGLLALLGHLSVNFWERFVIQSELTQMKTSLHSLRETLTNIGKAYDHLYVELRDLVDITEKKRFSTRFNTIEPAHSYKEKRPHILDRRRLHDLQVQTALLGENEYDRIRETDKSTEDKVKKENKNPQANFMHKNKNATTLTRYPPKTTGVGHEVERHPDTNCRKYIDDERTCRRDYESCQIKDYCGNWKY